VGQREVRIGDSMIECMRKRMESGVLGRGLHLYVPDVDGCNGSNRRLVYNAK